MLRISMRLATVRRKRNPIFVGTTVAENRMIYSVPKGAAGYFTETTSTSNTRVLKGGMGPLP